MAECDALVNVQMFPGKKRIDGGGGRHNDGLVSESVSKLHRSNGAQAKTKCLTAIYLFSGLYTGLIKSK